PRLAEVDPVEVDVHPETGPARRLGGGARQPGRAQVLDAGHQVALVQLETRLDQLLLLERVAHLDAGTLGGGLLVEGSRRQHGSAADAVAAGGGAEQDGDVARLPSGAE